MNSAKLDLLHQHAKRRDVMNKLVKFEDPKKVLFNNVIWNLIHMTLYILYSLYCAVGIAFFIAGAFLEFGQPYIKRQIIPELARKEANVMQQEKYYEVSVKTMTALSGYFGAYVMLFGTLCILVGIVGIFGLVKKLTGFMLMGAISNLLFLIFWFAVSLILSLGEAGISEIVAYVFSKVIVSNYIFDNTNKSKSGFTFAWDEIQYSLQCCGAKTYTEFQYVSQRITEHVVPASCCIDPHDLVCWDSPTRENSNILTPCKHAIWNVIDPYVEICQVVSSYIETLVFFLFWLSWVCIMKLVLLWRYRVRCLTESMNKT